MNGNGKVAMITGAGSGVGRACALAMLREGYSVVLTGRRREPLEKTRADAGTDGERALAVPADVSDPVSVEALFAKTEEAFGRLDSLPLPLPLSLSLSLSFLPLLFHSSPLLLFLLRCTIQTPCPLIHPLLLFLLSFKSLSNSL